MKKFEIFAVKRNTFSQTYRLLAECARPAFDSVEAESELVTGHMTEYSSSKFV